MDRLGFAAAWVRDIPLFDPRFGDAGQLFDPWTYLAYLAARTDSLALATGSATFTLRHPIDLAKAAASIDQLSGGRLVLGTASGDRASEFPAYGAPYASRGERYAQAVHLFRQLLRPGPANIAGPLGSLAGLELLPKPVAGAIPLIVTSSSGPPLAWIGRHADGWLTRSAPGAPAYRMAVFARICAMSGWTWWTTPIIRARPCAAAMCCARGARV